MPTTASHLYHSILLRAADEWGVDFEDVERDIGQQFDPVVRFLAGACASELELVYRNINSTEERLQQRLARVLLPEYFHLPTPAHALAAAQPEEESLLLDETVSFVREEDDKIAAFFSPIFSSRLLPLRLRVVASENGLIAFDKRSEGRSRKLAEADEIGALLLGFESPVPIADWQGASLFFDLRGGGGEEAEKARFFTALAKSRCFLNGRELSVNPGINANFLHLEDYLNGNERFQARVKARYDRHFLTFSDTEANSGQPQLAQDRLPEWFSRSISNEDDAVSILSQLDPAINKPLYWLEVRFGYPVELRQAASRLLVRFNVFPVANRRLCGAGNGEHHYLQNTSIKWIHLQPEEDFVSIRRVYTEKPPENPVFTFKPFADFKEDKKPSYTLRHGGVGRWDEFNAWRRLAYVVAILQENYQHHELIQKAADSLSLEEVHQLLGKKIAESDSPGKAGRDVYVLLHAGLNAGIRVRVEYWTSLGEGANGIPARTSLRCISRLASSLSSESVELISPTTGGKNPLEPAQQLDAMKSALLSRGRIVTREDVKAFCREFLGDKVSDIAVKDGVGTDARFDFGMTRLLDVILTPAPKALKEDWEGLCKQAQFLLEQNSASSIPIRVQLPQGHQLQPV